MDNKKISKVYKTEMVNWNDNIFSTLYVVKNLIHTNTYKHIQNIYNIFSNIWKSKQLLSGKKADIYKIYLYFI